MDLCPHYEEFYNHEGAIVAFLHCYSVFTTEGLVPKSMLK